MKIQVYKKSLLKKNLIIYLSALLVWGLIGCEFEIPTTPRLPSKWNTKVIIPLLDKTYSLSSLVFDSLAASSNPIFADTATGRLNYFTIDSSSKEITVSDSFWVIPSVKDSDKVDFSDQLIVNEDSTVAPINIRIGSNICSINNRVKYGNLKTTGNEDFNRILLSLSLTNSFPNPIRAEVKCENIKDQSGNTLISILSISPGDYVSSSIINIDGGSLISTNSEDYIDSLTFKISINVEDKLVTPLDSIYQSLTVKINMNPLELESFDGEVHAYDIIRTPIFLNSPPGAEGINFNLATISFSISDKCKQFDKLLIEIIGKKLVEDNTELDSLFSTFPDTCEMKLGQIMSNLPDSVIVCVTGIIMIDVNYPLTQVDINRGFSIRDSINVPFNFTLPSEMIIASANPTSFVIQDSSVRANVIKAQRGAVLETTVENRTPFHGLIYLLLGNYPFFPFDSTDVIANPDYELMGDSLYYIGNDTNFIGVDTLVVIDTLAVLEIPEATFSGYSLSEEGILDQISFVDSAAVSHFADTLTHYIMPHFLFLNPDTSSTILRDDQSIRIRSYLNLLLDPAALTHQGVDTSDTK